MQKLKIFSRSFVRSISDPVYYNDILKSKLSFSLKYFAFLNLLFTLIIGITIAVPLFKFDPTNFAEEVANTYPEELVVEVANGQVNINQDLPYTIPFPEHLFESEDDPDFDFDLVRFDDDKNIGNIRDFLDTKSVVTVTQSSIYTMNNDDGGEVRVYPVPDGEGMIIDRDSVNYVKDIIMENSLVKYRLYAPILSLLMMVLIFAGLYISRLIVVAIYTVFVDISRRIFMKDKKLSYSQEFQIGLHAFTPILVVETITNLLGVNLLGGWISFLLYMIWVLFIINKLKTKSEAKKA